VSTHKPWRDPAAEAAQRGQIANQATFMRAADFLLRDAKGFEHNSFKIDMARRAIVPRLDPGRKWHARSRNPTRKSGERYGPLISVRPHPASTATPRSPVRRNMPANSAPLTSPMAAWLHRRSPRDELWAIDTSEALRVDGVIDVLTHENRPRMADTDHAYKDDVAPEGSPFRPLYDDRILFSGQPIALVVAEEAEIARFAASLVLVKSDEEAHVTDVYRQRDECHCFGSPRKPGREPIRPSKAARRAEKAFAAAEVRHQGVYYVPIRASQPDGNVCLDGDRDGGGKLTVYDKTQGVQKRTALCMQRVRP